MSGDCCNLDCDGHAPRNKNRCGRCRKWFRYICAICGDPVDTNKRLYCHDCAWTTRTQWSKQYYKTLYRTIKKRYTGKWLENNPGYYKKYMRQYHIKHPRIKN